MKCQESEHLRASIELIMDHATTLRRGDTITYDLMTTASGIDRDTTGWRTLCRKLIKTMRQRRGIVLWAVDNVGYRLITIEEQLIDNPTRRLRKSRRQCLRAARETDAIPDSELTSKQRQIRTANSQIAKRASKESLRATRHVVAVQKTETTQQRIVRPSIKDAVRQV